MKRARPAASRPRSRCPRGQRRDSRVAEEIKHEMTLGNGYLGSRIDEERSEMRYLV